LRWNFWTSVPMSLELTSLPSRASSPNRSSQNTRTNFCRSHVMYRALMTWMLCAKKL